MTVRRGKKVATDFIDRARLYDFLFEREYEAWFCNLARRHFRRRELKDWILRLHTGESVFDTTKNWTWKSRQVLGNRQLLELAKDFVALYESVLSEEDWSLEHYRPFVERLLSSLELDGYVRRDGDFFFSEADVVDVEEEIGLLRQLHGALGLPNREETFEFLVLSESHYAAQRWSDSIGNARKFFEAVLSQIADATGRINGSPLPPRSRARPVEVRRFLESQHLLEHHEREAIDKLYGLLSHTGAHPYMAAKDQARLLRQLSATLTQFALLRLEGATQRAGAA